MDAAAFLNIEPGDLVRADGEEEWGTVFSITKDDNDLSCRANYDGDIYELAHWVIVEHKGVTAQQRKDALVALRVQTGDAGMGRIVTLNNRVTGFSAERLWVILNFTKNSGQKQVNVAPLNGPTEQEARSWAHDYMSVDIADTTPINFAQPLVKVGG